ncbi:MAG: cytochrome c [Burkholderiales bacterium]|nr:cytochrome c [Burkholderiales bacterium]
MKWTRRRTVAIVGAGLVLALLLVGDPFAPDSGRATLKPDDAVVAALGQRLYAGHCAVCHGAKLEGQPNWRERDAAGRLPAPPHDASGHTWHHPDDQLFRITKFGVGKATQVEDYTSSMPAYEGVLGDAEIVAVLSWIKGQWPADIRTKHDEMNRSAARRR